MCMVSFRFCCHHAIAATAAATRRAAWCCKRSIVVHDDQWPMMVSTATQTTAPNLTGHTSWGTLENMRLAQPNTISASTTCRTRTKSTTGTRTVFFVTVTAARCDAHAQAHTHTSSRSEAAVRWEVGKGRGDSRRSACLPIKSSHQPTTPTIRKRSTSRRTRG
jgi:hypothetical protein